MKKISTDVIIVGAGPTGLMLANQLERFGVDYVIIDKKPSTVPESRAIGVQARTVEFYYQLGIAKEAVKEGHRAVKADIFDDSGLRSTLEFATRYRGADTPYPFILDLEQNKNEVILLNNLKSSKSVWFDSKVTDVGQDKEKTWAKFEQKGKSYRVEGQYLAACDGSGSVVRKTLGLDFDGHRFDNDFLVMDYYGKFPWKLDGLGLTIKNSTFGLAFKLKEKDKYRLFAVVPPGDTQEKSPDEAKEIMLDNFPDGVEIDKVKWHSFYHVSSRMIKEFGHGRIFFAGDSAHIHSPAGGQGMNTGIGDSANLGWKLAYVLQKKADPELLDTYSLERTRFARGLLRTTDRVFNILSNGSTFSNFSLNYIFPIVFGSISRFSLLQSKFFERISQIALNHYTSPLSSGKVGKIRGGMRLPYFQVNEKKNSFDYCKSSKFVFFVFTDNEESGVFKDSKFEYDLVFVKDKSIREKYNLPVDSYVEVRPDMYIASCGKL